MNQNISKIGTVNSAFDTFKLKDVLTKNDAGDWGSEPESGGIGVIRSTNFTNQGKLNLSDVAFRSLKPNKLEEKKLSVGEILVERSGGSDSQPVGRVGLITNEIAEIGFAFANFIQRIAVDETIDSTYLHYCLQQMYEIGITASMQYQTTGIRNLDWKLYTKSVLPKPSKPEQTAIAAVLSKVDEAIATVERSVKSAERLKKALMQSLLTGKLKPNGEWRGADEFYTDEKFGKVPIGWEVKQLKKVSQSVQYGLNVNSTDEGKIPMFRMNNIISGKMVASPMVYVTLPDSEFEKYKLRKGDILFNRTNSLELVGKVGIFELEGDYVFASYLILVRIDEKNEPRFFNYFLNSYRGQNDLRSKATPAVSQANINAKSLRNTLVPRPSKDEQIAIADKLDECDKILETKQTKIQTLQRLKKSLMQNLLTGKKRVDIEKIEKLLEETKE